MYEKLLTSNELKEEGLFLLAYHLLRSYKLRQVLQRRTDHVLDFVKQISEDSKVADLCREIYFLVHNPYATLAEIQGEGLEHHYNLLKAGFKCNLFRMDGSSKRAVVDIN